jgi:hypothetical protein
VKTIDLDNSMNYYKSHLGSFLDIITQNLSMLRYHHLTTATLRKEQQKTEGLSLLLLQAHRMPELLPALSGAGVRPAGAPTESAAAGRLRVLVVCLRLPRPVPGRTARHPPADSPQLRALPNRSCVHLIIITVTRHDTTRHDTTRHDTTRHDTTRHDTQRKHAHNVAHS